MWSSYLPFLQTSMNAPPLKQTSVTPTLSVATLKDRTPVAVVLGIREMAKTVQVIKYIFFSKFVLLLDVSELAGLTKELRLGSSASDLS